MGFGIGVSGAGMGPRNVMESFATGSDKRGQIYNHRVISRMGRYLRPYRKTMALGFLAMLVVSGMTLLAPYLLKITIDTYITKGNQAGLIQISLWTVGAYIAMYIGTRVQQYLLSLVGQHMLTDMRNDLFRHLQELSLSYHNTHIAGVTVSRVMNDVATINDLLSQGIVTLIGDFLILIGIIVVMLTMDLGLALLTFIVLPLMLLATAWFSKHARVAFRETRTSVANVVGDLAEGIAGVRVIQAFGQEDTVQERFTAVNEVNRNATISAMKLSFIFLPTIEFLGILATAIVLWFGGRAVTNGVVTLGVLVAFLSYVARFFQPVQELSRMFTTLQSAMAGGEQVVNLLETVPDVVDQPDAQEMPPITGRIQFQHVSFTYGPELPEVLHDINLDIQPGQTIALVGPTGAGKTSISNLIARFYDPTDGTVLIDEIDIKTVQQRGLHRQIGLVPQDSFLFSGTIADNIRFGRPDASDEEVEKAARLANSHEFITAKQEGYATHIQEGASNISVGQRQLICIARAILTDPRILILDEATSNVDILTETLIQDALKVLLHARTAVVIAHRLSTIRSADLICVIDDGRIVEQGNHKELLAHKGVYAALYHRQFAD